MNTNTNTSDNRVAAMNGLAVVGFITLVAGGMWLAVYSAQYVPAAVSRLGAAAVSLTQIFNPAPESSLGVIPTASTTIPFPDSVVPPIATSTQPATTTAPTSPAPTPHPTPTPTPGPPISVLVPTGGTTETPLYGLPDLTVAITSVGYLSGSATDTFVPSTTVSNGDRPAVKFTVVNVGTNITGSWRFSADIPTRRSYTFKSDSQQSLRPGESIDYTLGFDEEDDGDDQPITITVNYDHTVTESNTNNNSDTVRVDID